LLQRVCIDVEIAVAKHERGCRRISDDVCDGVLTQPHLLEAHIHEAVEHEIGLVPGGFISVADHSLQGIGGLRGLGSGEAIELGALRGELIRGAPAAASSPAPDESSPADAPLAPGSAESAAASGGAGDPEPTSPARATPRPKL
jgi:hypothetical protein